MKDVMLDLETMGTTVDAPIVQIGACYFDRETGKIGKTFNMNVDLDSCLKIGCKPSADTILWWLEQSDEARKKVFDKFPIKFKIERVMDHFSDFIKNAEAIWSHATFDFVLLTNTYIKCGIEMPYSYTVARDLRTICDLGTEKGGKFKPKRGRIHHNALDDCKHQVEYTVEYLRRLLK